MKVANFENTNLEKSQTVRNNMQPHWLLFHDTSGDVQAQSDRFTLGVLSKQQDQFHHYSNKPTSIIMGDSLEQAKKTIPAEIHMISGCRDEQTSADVSNVGSFSLPDPAGRAGGALTSCLLNVAYKDHENSAVDLSFQDVLTKVREQLQKKGYTQIPQLSSSRPMDINKQFDFAPDNMSGTKRAVMMWVFCSTLSH